MSIFQIINESTPTKKPSLDEKKWVALALEYNKLKKKGITRAQFAEEKGLNPATFSRSLSRYASAIKTAEKIEKLETLPKHKLTKQDRQLLLINSFRSSIRDKIKNEGAAINNKSSKWFTDTIKSTVRSHKVSRPTPGRIYAYAYDAKHKDTLAYWDKFPLIIYLGMGKQGSSTLMYGLNLHYIPPKARQQFLEELLKQYASTPTITNKTKLKIDWSKVKGFKGADLMIKAYLPGNIQGSLAEIEPKDWANIIGLPLQQFMSKGKRFSANKVWKSY